MQRRLAILLAIFVSFILSNAAQATEQQEKIFYDLAFKKAFDAGCECKDAGSDFIKQVTLEKALKVAEEFRVPLNIATLNNIANQRYQEAGVTQAHLKGAEITAEWNRGAYEYRKKVAEKAARDASHDIIFLDKCP